MSKANQAEAWSRVFHRAITDYHVADHVDTGIVNPFPDQSLDALLYLKNWVDTVQWHLEDIIRDPNIDPTEALTLKRRIDSSNQKRTDLVESIDDIFFKQFSGSKADANAPLNTETPAWAIDRLSILELKIFHMQAEAERADAEPAHRQKCSEKLNTLLQQRMDLQGAIETLLTDLESGNKRMKLYRQMKMYNDESLNPVLYNKPS